MPPELNRVEEHAVSAGAFGETMSALASGVVLVTCLVDGQPWGTTVTAFASVSADPPTVLVSLSSGGVAARAIAASGRYGVSILAADQVEIAARCSLPGEPKFLADRRVADALAHLDCEVDDELEVADHTIFFGRVVAARTARRAAPLLYHRRGYRMVAAT
jgi:flavin reductase ActVB